MATEIPTLSREDILRAIRDSADDLLHMKPGDVTLVSVVCGYGRKVKRINGKWRVADKGCQWRTKKGEEAWRAHMKTTHPRARI